MPLNVLIAGGGPAALEAALTLHRLAGERVVTTTVLAPDHEFNYRPLSVLEPFAAGRRDRLPAHAHRGRRGLPAPAGSLASVDSRRPTPCRPHDGEQIGYDVLRRRRRRRADATAPRA